jgi:hypothetical protein
MAAHAFRCSHARITIAAAFACALAACSGGGGNSSPAASPAPSVILLSTTAMTFAGFGSTVPAEQVQVAENGYAGVFSENDTCTPQTGAQIAGVSETSPGNPATYSVTPLADGTCVATFTDTNGQTAKVTITIGTSGTQSGPRE